MSEQLLTRGEFERIANLAIKAATAEHTFVSLSDSTGGTTRFANNQITQNVNSRRLSFSTSVAFGKQRGSASTTDLSDESVKECVRRAEASARLVPEDPEYLPPLPPQVYPILASLRSETARCGPARRATEAGRAIRQCREAGLQAAGIVSAYASAEGVAASSGLLAFEQRSSAQFSLTATGEDSSGWVNDQNRSIDDLRVDDRTRVAIDKALRSAKPREAPAGRYTVILEPAAVAGLLGALLWPLNAKGYYKGTSALAGKLGQRIMDARLSLQNRPDHPALLGDAFDGSGLPSDSRTWIDHGVLRQLNYDRFTAQQHNTSPSYAPDALHLSGENPSGESVDDLIRTTQRGILVTNFWYIRSVNATDLTLTGMTRDGTFMIEDGQISGGLINFRWHDSPLRVFDAVDEFTTPLDAITMERDKMLLPAMRVRDFNFSSVTRF